MLPLWWLGLLVQLLGEIGNLMAVGYAPAAITFPLGCVSLIINVAVVSVAATQFFTIEDPVERALVQEHPLQYGPTLLKGLLGRAAEVLFARPFPWPWAST